MRRQQVAFHPIGKKLQGVLARFAFAHALLLRAQAMRNPSGQGVTLNRVNLHADAVVLQRGKPRGAFGGFVQARQQHHRQSAVIAHRQFRNVLQRHAAIFTGLARGDADFNQLLVGKQTHGATGRQHLAPVKVRACHGEHAALGEALRTRGDTQGV